MKVSNSLALSAAVAGLVAGGVTLATSPNALAAAGGKAACYNSCAGKNACGGKNPPVQAKDGCAGHIKFKHDMTAAQCEKHGGTPKAAGESAAPAAGAPATGGAAPSGQ